MSIAQNIDIGQRQKMQMLDSLTSFSLLVYTVGQSKIKMVAANTVMKHKYDIILFQTKGVPHKCYKLIFA